MLAFRPAIEVGPLPNLPLFDGFGPGGIRNFRTLDLLLALNVLLFFDRRRCARSGRRPGRYRTSGPRRRRPGPCGPRSWPGGAPLCRGGVSRRRGANRRRRFLDGQADDPGRHLFLLGFAPLPLQRGSRVTRGRRLGGSRRGRCRGLLRRCGRRRLRSFGGHFGGHFGRHFFSHRGFFGRDGRRGLDGSRLPFGRLGRQRYYPGHRLLGFPGLGRLLGRRRRHFRFRGTLRRRFYRGYRRRHHPPAALDIITHAQFLDLGRRRADYLSRPGHRRVVQRTEIGEIFLQPQIILEALDQLPHFHLEFLGQINNPGLAHISNLTPDTYFALGANKTISSTFLNLGRLLNRLGRFFRPALVCHVPGCGDERRGLLLGQAGGLGQLFPTGFRHLSGR